MTIRSICLTPTQINRINAAAEAAYPTEACGLITGRLTNSSILVVTRVVEAQNILASKATDRFEIDPATRISLEKDIRGTNEQLIAHYHSHPDNPAQPSSTDLEKTHEPELVWIIVSVMAGKATNMTAHRVIDGASGFEAINLLTVKPSNVSTISQINLDS